MIKKVTISYFDAEKELEAYYVCPSDKKSPFVILCHAWAGRDAFIMEAADRIAQWGYNALALDMYGKNVLGKSKEENAALKKPFIDDRSLLKRRVLKGYELAGSLAGVDTAQTAVLGFGFGGVCALDLARTGVPLAGAISVYGHFEVPGNVEVKPIQARVLILQGVNDPIATVDQLQIFGKELDTTNTQWQANIYGNSMHAFINPQANAPQAGIVYNPITAQAAWQDIENFLKQLWEK